MKKIAFYGGSFDPPHNAHLAIARTLLVQFTLDEFVFIPAFHAPHKLRTDPTSAYDRFAMLCLATQNEQRVTVSKIELEVPERPYSVETLTRLQALFPHDAIYFVMGADSWRDITSWRDWEKVLSLSNHIVVTRPGADMGVSHVNEDVQGRIVDLRHRESCLPLSKSDAARGKYIYFTNAVDLDISATAIRKKIREADSSWKSEVPVQVANYIEKYQIYT